MQRVRIYSTEEGETQFFGMTPEYLNLVGERVSESGRVELVDSPMSADFAVSAHSEMAVVLSGVHEYETSDGEKRRFFPGDVIVLEDTAGKGHIFRAFGKEKAISLRFPVADAQ
jgi:hypothetical protein